MCARYVFFSGRAFGDEFGVVPIPDLTPRYNIAPTQIAPVVTLFQGKLKLEFMQWGLVPSWSKDPMSSTKLINARSETVREKPSFRNAFSKRRCLVPADGFYEWKGVPGKKQPYYIYEGRGPMAFAGLWEHWEGVEGELTTFTILTTHANKLMSEIHERMPVILDKDRADLWLDMNAPAELVSTLFEPRDDDDLAMYPVGKAVGNPRFDDPSLLVEVKSPNLFD